MKKLKLLTTPTQISRFKLDDLEYDAAPIKEDKVARLQIKRWRRLKHRTDHVNI